MRIPAPIRRNTADWVLQFVNIVFLLLLYFLVRGSVYQQQQPGIELPVTMLAPATAAPADAIYVNRDGVLTWHGKVQSASEAAAAIAAEERLIQVTIVADRALPAPALISLVHALRIKGMQGIALMTAQEPRP